MNRIKILIVDDSAVVRAALSKMLSADSEIEVVGTAPDPYIAMDKIETLKPDVITLDIEMPKMDGLTFLEKLMKINPIPVIMVSTWTSNNSDKAIKSLSLGAFDFVQKPSNSSMLMEMQNEIISKIKTAGKCSLPKLISPGPKIKTASSNNILLNAVDNIKQNDDRIILIGASTGGTVALESILKKLPNTLPGIVIVQHMPEHFTKAFADRLDSLCKINIKEAEDGDEVRYGCAYIAPGGKQCYVNKKNGKYKIIINDDEPVNRHKPSVDVMFLSAAKNNCSNVLSIILTGMGKDGAKGMLTLKQLGSYNIAQDEESCVVYGMPREAFEIGASHEVRNINEIPTRIIDIIQNNKK